MSTSARRKVPPVAACYRIDLLAERFLRGGMSFDGAVKTARKRKS
jgi:hypothetical protein